MKKITLWGLLFGFILVLGITSCVPKPPSKNESNQGVEQQPTAAKPTQAPPVKQAPASIPPNKASETNLPPTAAVKQETKIIESASVEKTETTKSKLPESPTNAAPTEGSYCAGKKVLLAIPDRDEDENAPEEGWCGETSIQMAMDYFGKSVSQYEINLAGKPTHPDLWEDDIPVALDTLGVTYTVWDEKNKDLHQFMLWLGQQLQAGSPIVLGVKFYPDETGWENDHFVLAVGCDQGGIYMNTNNAGDGQAYITYAELTKNFDDSYSLVNKQNYHFGVAIHGLKK